MNGFQFALLSDPRLAAQALSPTPAWLWSTDATRILWANPTAAATFDAQSPGALASIKFASQHPAAAQIARLAGTLPQSGAPRLERLRGFGARFGGLMVCLCSRFTLHGNTGAVLVLASERAGPDLALAERARRLLADADRPAAIFTTEGELIECNAAAHGHLGGAHNLAALGADNLAKQASASGQAEGSIATGHVMLHRLGTGTTTALLVSFAASAVEPAKAAGEAPAIEPAIEPTIIGTETAEREPDISPPPAEAVPIVAATGMTPPPAETAPPQAESAPSPAEAPPAPVPAPESAKRRFPLRFVWQMDAATRFTLDSKEFANLIGPTAGMLGRPWAEIAGALNLDPAGSVARALAARETFGGIVLSWPAGDGRLPIEMSGLPVFGRDRQFEGFRGFGVCRDVDRIVALTQQPVQPAAEPQVPVEPPAPAAPTANVLPFPAAPPPEAPPTLSPVEHNAFQELARELSDRLKKPGGQGAGAEAAAQLRPEPVAAAPAPVPRKPPRNDNRARDTQESRAILDRLSTGILVYRLNNLLYANRAFLDWTGYSSLEALAEAGGLDSLFIESTDAAAENGKNGGRTLTIATPRGEQMPVEGRLFSIPWNGEPALALMLNTTAAPATGKDTEQALRRIERENHELKAVLDTATDGVLMLDRAGRVLSANRSAEALFGYGADELEVLSFSDLFAPESRRMASDYLDHVAREASPMLLNEGKEVVGLVRQGGLVPLYVTIGRIEDGDKLCAVFRDMTAGKRAEQELTNARREAEKASSAKSEFLAKISHELRTPLNVIIGFSEVMMNERFGPVANERYLQYLRNIHASGSHLIALINDLLDLSKIEAGRLALTFANINLNEIVLQCVGVVQHQANQERVIIRTSLATTLPPIVADARSVRQIALNLLSNSLKFAGTGGQVIVSTALTDEGEVALRVRDTGAGMSEKDIETALEPFRQIATAPRTGGINLWLPISKALAEANHAQFHISSQVASGTLVEVVFPAAKTK